MTEVRHLGFDAELFWGALRTPLWHILQLRFSATTQELEKPSCWSCRTVAPLSVNSPESPESLIWLDKEYSLNHIKGPYIIQGILLN